MNLYAPKGGLSDGESCIEPAACIRGCLMCYGTVLPPIMPRTIATWNDCNMRWDTDRRRCCGSVTYPRHTYHARLRAPTGAPSTGIGCSISADAHNESLLRFGGFGSRKVMRQEDELVQDGVVPVRVVVRAGERYVGVRHMPRQEQAM